MLEKRYQLRRLKRILLGNWILHRSICFSGIYKMKCVHFNEVCVMKVKTLDSFSSHILKSSVKRATKNIQHCCKTSWIAMLRVLPPNKKNLGTDYVLRHVRTMVVKRAISPCNSFYSNVAKQVARSLLPLKYLKSVTLLIRRLPWLRGEPILWNISCTFDHLTAACFHNHHRFYHLPQQKQLMDS